jgi:hypothetical protein
VIGAFALAASLHAGYDWLLGLGYEVLAFGLLALAFAYFVRLFFHARAVSRYFAELQRNAAP